MEGSGERRFGPTVAVIERAKAEMLEREKTFRANGRVIYDKKKTLLPNLGPSSSSQSQSGSSFANIGRKAVYLTSEARERMMKEKRLSDEAEKRRLEGLAVVPVQQNDWLSIKNERVFNAYPIPAPVPQQNWQNRRPVQPPPWQYRPALAENSAVVVEKSQPKPVNPRPMLMLPMSGQVTNVYPSPKRPNKLVAHPPAKKPRCMSTKSAPSNKSKTKPPKSGSLNSPAVKGSKVSTAVAIPKASGQLEKWQPTGRGSKTVIENESDMDMYTRRPRTPIPKIILRRIPRRKNCWEIIQKTIDTTEQTYKGNAAPAKNTVKTLAIAGKVSPKKSSSTRNTGTDPIPASSDEERLLAFSSLQSIGYPYPGLIGSPVRDHAFDKVMECYVKWRSISVARQAKERAGLPLSPLRATPPRELNNEKNDGQKQLAITYHNETAAIPPAKNPKTSKKVSTAPSGFGAAQVQSQADAVATATPKTSSYLSCIPKKLNLSEDSDSDAEGKTPQAKDLPNKSLQGVLKIEPGQNKNGTKVKKISPRDVKPRIKIEPQETMDLDLDQDDAFAQMNYPTSISSSNAKAPDVKIKRERMDVSLIIPTPMEMSTSWAGQPGQNHVKQELIVVKSEPTLRRSLRLKTKRCFEGFSME